MGQFTSKEQKISTTIDIPMVSKTMCFGLVFKLANSIESPSRSVSHLQNTSRLSSGLFHNVMGESISISPKVGLVSFLESIVTLKMPFSNVHVIFDLCQFEALAKPLIREVVFEQTIESSSFHILLTPIV